MPTRPSAFTSMSKTAFHLLLLALFGLGLGCKSPLSEAPSAPPGAESATVLFSIGARELLTASQRAGPSARASLGFSFQNIARLRIDVLVREADGGTSSLFRNADLSRGADGLWTGQLPFLPRNKPLSFVATASSASGAELFRGSTDQTLTEDNTPVSIVLAPVTDGADISLPRVQRITLPAELFSEQSFPVHFLVEARAGERLDYAMEEGASGAAGGTFSPSQGSLVLGSTSATFVLHYTAPPVPSITDFSHAIRITNRDGHSVSTTFRLRVRPPSSDGVRDTSAVVRFNPVINALSAVRVPGAPQVALEASVSDDRPLSELSYSWSLTPDGPDAPPTFSPQANPTLLQGYTLELRGTLRLEVTDAEGGRTTLRYVVPPHQFPDNPIQDNGFKSLLAGEGHTCTLLDTGKVRCWGRNDSGQLGHGHTHPLGDDELLSTVGTVPLAESGLQLAVGGHHTCALLEGGAVRCWGRNDSGQLGYGHTRPVGDDEAVSGSGYVPFGGRAVELVAGFAHSCALLDTGKVRCWGHNTHGQLGLRHTRPIGDDEAPASAEDVDVGGPVRHLVAGAWHTCAQLTTGAVRCWGRNDSGQLGLGHTRPVGDDESPASVGEVNLGGPVLLLAAHATGQHTCARLDSGAVRCWGRNAHGQLGLGHTQSIGDDETPASVASVTTGGIALQLATGADHTCALLSPGVLKCWGRNESGQLGLGHTSSLSTPPASRVDLGGAMAFQVAAGAWHTCALPGSGEPRCWGRNTHGQLGLGHTYNLGDDEPLSGAARTTPLPPVVVETFQSAASVGGGGSLSFLVQAMDPQASRLSFSWTANTGTLSTATTATDTSQVSWTAPACVHSGATPLLTASVSNALGLSTTQRFSVTLPACWALASPMAEGRALHEATLLHDGRVLVSGGFKGGYPSLKTVELYDPGSGSWSAARPMAAARKDHTATLLNDGRVLVTGGQNDNNYLNSTEVYAPDSDTWRPAGTLSVPRHLHVATLLLDGRVLVMGGVNGSSSQMAVDMYNPDLGTWRAVAPMGTRRYRHTATLLNNGKVLVVGGTNTGYLATAEVYDPDLDTWRAVAPMGGPRTFHTATLLLDGRVLVTGGNNKPTSYLATAQLYDPDLDTWSAAAPMAVPRYGHTATLLSDGRVLIVGGYNGEYLGTAEVYDPASDTWHTVSMTSSRSHHAATLLWDGSVLVSGGSNGRYLGTTEVYTPGPL